MKASQAKRALILANIFNFLAAIYLIVIAIVSLVKLRWYHQLTIAVKTRHVITSATSYFAFFILIFTGLVLVSIFIVASMRLNARSYVSPSGNQQAIATSTSEPVTTNNSTNNQESGNTSKQTFVKQRMPNGRFSPITMTSRTDTNSVVCCSIILHLIASASLIVVLVLWLLNTGELVRDSISTQLEYAFSKYQFPNRTNPYSVAIDGMQDINHCCGSLDYTDFPHHRVSALSSGHYPGSCCGNTIFAVNARVTCSPEEIVRARQTTGCTKVLANYYDLISLLVVPVALVSLFVNITVIGLVIISKSHSDGISFTDSRFHDPIGSSRGRFKLKQQRSVS